MWFRYKIWNVCTGGLLLGVFGLYDSKGSQYTALLQQQQLLLLLQERGFFTFTDKQQQRDILCTDLQDLNAAPLHPQ